MSIRIFIISFLALTLINITAQNDSLKVDSLKYNSINIELAGVGGLFSLSYSRSIQINNNIGFITEIGFSPFNPSLKDFEFSPRLPIQIKFFYKINKHTIETGLAMTPYFYYNTKNVQLAFFSLIGYKYSIFKAKYTVGIAFTPQFFDFGEFHFYPWGSLSLGYKF
jgi:hypothetical protein